MYNRGRKEKQNTAILSTVNKARVSAVGKIVIRLSIEDFDGRLGSKNRRRVDALIRRADFLRSRVSADNRELSFDRQELSALEWAIDQIHRTHPIKTLREQP
jgi:hypothetical protein